MITIIDIESIVFSRANTALIETFNPIFVTGEFISIPPSFPAVGIVEIDNSAYQRSQDAQSHEHHAGLLYQVDAFSNLAKGRKSQCKQLIAVVDDVMQSLFFTRISCLPTPFENPSTYRMTARYRAVVSRDGQMYRR